MLVAQRLGGCNHTFTGREKIQPFMFAGMDESFEVKDQKKPQKRFQNFKKRYLYPKQIFVEVRYEPIDFSIKYEDGQELSYRKVTSIWIPINYLESQELERHNAFKRNKAA